MHKCMQAEVSSEVASLTATGSSRAVTVIFDVKLDKCPGSSNYNHTIASRAAFHNTPRLPISLSHTTTFIRLARQVNCAIHISHCWILISLLLSSASIWQLKIPAALYTCLAQTFKDLRAKKKKKKARTRCEQGKSSQQQLYYWQRHMQHVSSSARTITSDGQTNTWH